MAIIIFSGFGNFFFQRISVLKIDKLANQPLNYVILTCLRGVDSYTQVKYVGIVIFIA